MTDRTAEAKARELELDLKANAPLANYVPAVRTGNLVFLSGHGPVHEGKLIRGRLGGNLDVEQGREAARAVAVQLLASLRAEIGSLDRVSRIVKLLCLVNSTRKFKDHPQVANGASDLLVEVFGERGKHARSAIGVPSLPAGMAVEIEMVVEVD